MSALPAIQKQALLDIKKLRACLNEALSALADIEDQVKLIVKSKTPVKSEFAVAAHEITRAFTSDEMSEALKTFTPSYCMLHSIRLDARPNRTVVSRNKRVLQLVSMLSEAAGVDPQEFVHLDASGRKSAMQNVIKFLQRKLRNQHGH